MRANLFVKVFVAFWLVTLAVLGSWMLAAEYFDSRPLPIESRREHPPGSPHRLILRLIYDLQQVERAELAARIEQVHERYGLQVFLLDAAGRDVLGRDVPADVQRIADRVLGTRRRVHERRPGERLLAHEIYRRDLGPLRAVFRIERPGGALLSVLGGNPWLRSALAVLVSGLVCYALSRLLTRRLQALRAASRRLANGDLQVRLRVRERGGDETDELARDFNSMASQLEGRIQAQKRLLQDVSHELRSPLARLHIALALAQEDAGGRAAALARIEREAERLEALISQLLSSQAQDIALDSHIDLVALLRELCEDAAFEGAQRDARVAFDSALPQAIVASAGDLLHKSFDNLLRNALAHGPEGGAVRVALATDGANFYVTFQDAGPGVPEAELGAIFDAFYRLDSARTRDTGGYGLGLSIARRAIEQHGGRVRAENTHPGLRVTVTLPRSAGLEDATGSED